MREKLVQDLNCVRWERNLGRGTRSNYSNYVGWERNMGEGNKDRADIITAQWEKNQRN